MILLKIFYPQIIVWQIEYLVNITMPPKQTTKTKARDQQPLLTSTSVATSLSPPRFPPHDSNLRQLYKTSRHPHLPTSLSIPDQLTRFLGTILPLDTQHSFRDNGYFRAVADTAVKLTCPSLGIRHWTECKEFIELSRIQSHSNNGKDTSIEDNNNSKRKRRRRWTRRKIAYGDHSMQYIDLFLPTSPAAESNTTTKKYDSRIPVRGTIFFVHGGAWGAGHPWMYRLVAPTFLKLNFAVCIVGYRTYPDAKDIIEDQTKDVQLAWKKCGSVLNELVVPISGKEWVGNVVMGHSSGAHVGLLMLVEWVDNQMKNNQSDNSISKQQYPWIPNYFIGLSGPYDISYHFDYEGGRGVEQISPLKPICGHTRENFTRASPVKRLLALLPKQTNDSSRSDSTIQKLMPPILLVHGIEDTVVPFTATSDAGRQLRSCGLECDEIYLSETSHQDVIMMFMLGGKAKDLTIDWLFKRNDENGKKVQITAPILSRL